MEINKIYNEDCFITMSKMPDNFVDVSFTSPPYNRKRNDKYTFYDDTIVDYFGFLKRTINELLRVTKGNIYLNIQKNYYNKKDVFDLIGYFSKDIYDIVVWEKSNPLPASGLSITNAYELILVFGKSFKSNRTYTKNHITTSVNRMPPEHKAVMHPDVAKYFINNFTKEGDVIYDPFMGIGTTALIASQKNRQYIGSEISKEYCDMAQEVINWNKGKN